MYNRWRLAFAGVGGSMEFVCCACICGSGEAMCWAMNGPMGTEDDEERWDNLGVVEAESERARISMYMYNMC